MREKHMQEHEKEPERGSDQSSSLDLIRYMRGQSRHLPGLKPPVDRVLAVHKDRLTYTFIIDHEVASIHYDQRRQEIFLSGHNIRHMQLSEAERESLIALQELLRHDAEGKIFFSGYQATLGRILADNKK